MFWGGSSLECEVLTVSVQAVDSEKKRKKNQYMIFPFFFVKYPQSRLRIPHLRDSAWTFVSVAFLRTWDGKTSLTLQEGG